MDKIIVTTKEELQEIIEGSVRKVLSDQNSDQTSNTGLPPILLTLKEASALLKLAPQTIYGFTSKRTIPFLKRGKKLYFHKEALVAWLEEGKKRTVKQMQEEIELNGKFKI